MLTVRYLQQAHQSPYLYMISTMRFSPNNSH